MTDIKAFNTHRGYGDRGQRIAYRVLETEQHNDVVATSRVVFMDADRLIGGFASVEHGIPGGPEPHEVLLAYDQGRYDKLTCQATRNQLRYVAEQL